MEIFSPNNGWKKASGHTPALIAPEKADALPHPVRKEANKIRGIDTEPSPFV